MNMKYFVLIVYLICFFVYEYIFKRIVGVNVTVLVLSFKRSTVT